MGQGIDISMIDPEHACTLEECLESEFLGCLVRQAGLVILGHKPASVFGFKPRAWRGAADSRARRIICDQLVSVYSKKLGSYGVRLAWLARRDRDLMLLCWRTSQIDGVLADADDCALLDEAGLPTDSADALMAALVGRLRAYYAGRAEFPHEVGVVLGYPVEDVRGFMADGGRGAVACGRWKVYGDPGTAARRFEELGAKERYCKRLYSEGVPMRELLRMGAA